MKIQQMVRNFHSHEKVKRLREDAMSNLVPWNPESESSGHFLLLQLD